MSFIKSYVSKGAIYILGNENNIYNLAREIPSSSNENIFTESLQKLPPFLNFKKVFINYTGDRKELNCSILDLLAILDVIYIVKYNSNN